MNFNQRIPNFKSSFKNWFRQLLQQMLVESIQFFPPTWKWRIWKGHGCHPVGLSTYHPVQPHNTLVLHTWSLGQPNQCKCSNLETQKRYKLWPFHRQRVPTLKLKLNFFKNALVTSFSPAHSHHLVNLAGQTLTSLRFWSRPFDQIFYYALLALRRRCAAKGINF